MNKQAASPARIALMAGFALSCVGLLLFLWLSFGGAIPLQPNGYRVDVLFPQANQLATQADVRVAGIRIGTVVATRADPSGLTRATLQLDRPYVPLRADARAILRQKSLLGDTYVELTLGNRAARPVPDGGQLARAQVSRAVQLDEVYRTFDPATRRAFQVWMQDQAHALARRGRDLNDAIGDLAPLTEHGADLLDVIRPQDAAVQTLVRETGQVFGTVADHRDEIRALITSADRVFATTAARGRALAQTLRLLPGFQRQATLTVRRLGRFSATATPVLDALRPAARALAPTVQALGNTAPHVRRVFADLDPAIAASRTGLPAADRTLLAARPALDALEPFLSNLNPMLRYLAPYQHEIATFFANTVAAINATDVPPGTHERHHYLRTLSPMNPEALAASPRRLPTNRSNPYRLPGQFHELPHGLPVFEDRNCGTTTAVSVLPTTPLDPVLRALLTQALGPIDSTAPACRRQPPFRIGGRTSDYPQIRRAARP